MKVITLKNIEERVSHHAEKYGDKIEQGVSAIKRKKLRKGRIRPRDLVEGRILDNFER